MFNLSNFQFQSDNCDYQTKQKVSFAEPETGSGECVSDKRGIFSDSKLDIGTLPKKFDLVRPLMIFLLAFLAGTATASLPVSPSAELWAKLHREQPILDEYPDECETGPKSGAVYQNPLPLASLKPLQVTVDGPPMYIVDNPEAYQTPGILGSTIAPVLGRGDGRFDFPGAGRLFVLANNQIKAASDRQWLTGVVYNPNDYEIELSLRGILYAPRITPVTGNVSPNYQQGVFAGTHAIVSSSFLDFSPGRNGAFERRLKVPAKQSRIIVESQHIRGTEIFALVDIKAAARTDLFRLAVVASLKALTAEDLISVSNGRYTTAGKPEDYAYAGPTRYGRPNGVFPFGNTYRGGRTIEVKRGQADGDLVFATRFRYVGNGPTDLPKLDPVLPNPPEVPGPAANHDDGSYGMSYSLRYTLKNPAASPIDVTVAITSPRSPLDNNLKPLGGIMTLPLILNGKRYNMRVNERGGGTVIEKFRLDAGAARVVTIEFTHFGNTFPPAAFEFRVP
jgi:hypothetical protein